MAKKRTSLDSFISRPEPATRAEPALVAAIAPPTQHGRRPNCKQQTVYLPLPVYEQLRSPAFENREYMHDYLLEGLDLVFQRRGLPDFDELKRKQP